LLGQAGAANKKQWQGTSILTSHMSLFCLTEETGLRRFLFAMALKPDTKQSWCTLNVQWYATRWSGGQRLAVDIIKSSHLPCPMIGPQVICVARSKIALKGSKWCVRHNPGSLAYITHDETYSKRAIWSAGEGQRITHNNLSSSGFQSKRNMHCVDPS